VRVISTLKNEALVNESIGGGYIERNWPHALEEQGAWPLAGLRQSFLDGSLTGLLDADTSLRAKIVEFVSRGDFGLPSGQKADGIFERLWFEERLPADEVAFDSGVFLLAKATAKALKTPGRPASPGEPAPALGPGPGPAPAPEPGRVDKRSCTSRTNGRRVGRLDRPRGSGGRLRW
jgi:hypothetical protein